jgi:hypothetical protein
VIIASSVGRSPQIPPSLIQQVNLDSVDFISNDQLLEALGSTTATPEQIAEAVRINEEARLRALQASFLVLAGIAALAIFPAGGLPGYLPGEVPSDEPEDLAKGGKPKVARTA